MVEIMVNKLLEEYRKGFKLSCTSLDVTMQETLRALVTYGYTYDEFRTDIDRLIEYDDWERRIDNKINDISVFTKYENFSVLFKSLTFYEFVTTYLYENSCFEIPKIDNSKLNQKLKQIAKMKIYLLKVEKKITTELAFEQEKSKNINIEEIDE